MLKEIKKELNQKNKLDKLTKKNKIILEQAWFKDQIQICKKCNRIKNLTIDHIIPKDILLQFGIEADRHFWEDNLQVLCGVCNMFKGNRLDFSNKETIKLLQYLLNKINY